VKGEILMVDKKQNIKPEDTELEKEGLDD